MPKYFVTIFTILILLLPACVSAEVFTSAFLNDLTSKFVYTNIETDKEHAIVSSEIKKQDDGSFQVFVKGEGGYNLYDDVTFTMESHIQVDGEFVIVDQSDIKVFDKKGKQIEFTRKTFDYETNVVYFKEFNAKGDVLKERDYALEGHTCDGITIAMCLRRYIHNWNQEKSHSLYMITNEPKMYHVKIFDLGEVETKLLTGEKMTTHKYQVMADLGPLTKIIAKLVPSTYFYFLPEPPYYLVQYEGLDGGLRSNHVRAKMASQKPPLLAQ